MYDNDNYIKAVKEAAWDLHDVASKLGLKLGKGESGESRNYHSPTHADRSASLSIFKVQNGYAWKDHSADYGGDAIELVRYTNDCSFMEAVKLLAGWYHVVDDRQPLATQRKKTLPEMIADQVLHKDTPKDKLTEYLKGRGITDAVIELAIKSRAVGFNTYASPTKERGEKGYGGEGVAFVVRDRYSNEVIAVDTRYLDPELNGGLKTNSQGEKADAPWCLSWESIRKAHTIYVVESAINALSVLSALGTKRSVGVLALRGTANAENVSEGLFEGKQVILCMDWDKPHTEGKLKGMQAGAKAAWSLYDRLTRAGIATQLIDQTDWVLGEDINDVLKKQGLLAARSALEKLETCAIAGLPAKAVEGAKSRFFLPQHDYEKYWRYQVKSDFTIFLDKYKYDEEGELKPLEFIDLAAFRVAHVGRISIQSWQATVLNAPDGRPDTMFNVICQTSQHGHTLRKATMTDDQYTNLQTWAKFGYIYKPAEFMRLTSILTRTLDDTEELAVNYVGLAYKNGKVVVNNGTDCYFRSPDKQCPYSNLIFNSGDPAHASTLIHAYQETFKNNAALIPFVWALGAHLKIFLGWYPHLQMEAEKGSGKSTLMDALSRSLQMEVFGADMLKTSYRSQHSVSYTGHPVMWEEVGANSQDSIKSASDRLQEAYNYRHAIRGDLAYLSSAPVLLGGEEVDMNSLIGKLTRTSLKAKLQGSPISGNLPVFPLKEWLEYLAKIQRGTVESDLETTARFLAEKSCARPDDANARRIIKNFAAIGIAWKYLCAFAQVDPRQGGFITSLTAEMNSFLAETEASRQPWVWIVEIIFSEIDAGRFNYPMAVNYRHKLKDGTEDEVLYVRHTHMMDHLRHSNHLKGRLEALPIKSPKTFKSQMLSAGVIVEEGIERKIQERRTSGLIALSLSKLADFGLSTAREIVAAVE